MEVEEVGNNVTSDVGVDVEVEEEEEKKGTGISNTSGISYTWSKMEPNRWIVQETGRSLRPISAAEFPSEIGSWKGIRSWAQTDQVSGNTSFEEMDPDMVRIVDYDVLYENQSGNEEIVQHCFPVVRGTPGSQSNYTNVIPKFGEC